VLQAFDLLQQAWVVGVVCVPTLDQIIDFQLILAVQSGSSGAIPAVWLAVR
jgi:hypothetical protein